MVVDLYYITTPRLWDMPCEPVSGGVAALQLGEVNSEDLKALYANVSDWPVAQRFCLCLDIATTPLDALLIEYLVTFFFFPNYETTAGAPEVLIVTVRTGEANYFVNVLTEAAKAQGFPSIVLHYFRADEPISIHEYNPDALEELKKAYQAIAKSAVSRLYVKVEQPSAIGQVKQLLQEEDAVFRQQEPQLYQLLQKNRSLQRRNQQLELLTAAAAREISGQVAHMQVLRSGTQATHLQNYYTNEYEVLPSWYKRFGHLLKVVMGKRSFRSLFNDNVKKYK